MKLLKRLIFIIFNKLVYIGGYELAPLNTKYGGYLDAAKTISAAHQQGQSVCEYVETLWHQQDCTDYVIQEMGRAGCLSPATRVCEIGPGTGRYLERVLKQVTPKQYDIYEIADDWAKWLADTYAPVVIRQPVDGRTLRDTPSASCNLVHAHGVFVLLPFLHAFEYFAEMVRVCTPHGYVVFDFFSGEYFDMKVIDLWLASPDRYPVLLPYETVLRYFYRHCFTLVHTFKNKYGHSYSYYVILQKSG